VAAADEINNGCVRRRRRRQVDYVFATDSQALDAQRLISRQEGILPALEPSHALHCVTEMAKKMKPSEIILVNLCGRGDKDMLHVAKARGVTIDTDVLLTKDDVAASEASAAAAAAALQPAPCLAMAAAAAAIAGIVYLKSL
jgi:threonine synthase